MRSRDRARLTFDPKDDFGALEQRYRCLSCHSIRGSGDPQACDITYEGSKVNRQWLYSFPQTSLLDAAHDYDRDADLQLPRRRRSVHGRLHVAGVCRSRHRGGLEIPSRPPTRNTARRCSTPKAASPAIKLHDQGGDVGPSLTTQVPEFGQGTWVGDKLRGEWIFQWLKNPQALVPEHDRAESWPERSGSRSISQPIC